MLKSTKIVATMGPTCDSAEMIERLILEGVDIFRFNFKHNTADWHKERIERVKELAERLAAPTAILIDLPGPMIRIHMPFDGVEIKKDEAVLLKDTHTEGDEKSISISHPNIIPLLKKGQKIFADDGNFVFHVESNDGPCVLRSSSSGVLRNGKSVNIPDIDFSSPIITERDIEGLKLAKHMDADFVALSFVRDESDLKRVREEMKNLGVNSKLISKIENKKAILNIDSIIKLSDGIMIARGDMGVEMPIEQVPYHQKTIAKKCIEKGIPFIIATQMLHSMVSNPIPTRAEISDVANAVYDLADAVMLSAETAYGKYPAETVAVMRKTIEFNSAKQNGDINTTRDKRAIEGGTSTVKMLKIR